MCQQQRRPDPSINKCKQCPDNKSSTSAPYNRHIGRASLWSPTVTPALNNYLHPHLVFKSIVVQGILMGTRHTEASKLKYCFIQFRWLRNRLDNQFFKKSWYVQSLGSVFKIIFLKKVIVTINTHSLHAAVSTMRCILFFKHSCPSAVYMMIKL